VLQINLGTEKIGLTSDEATWGLSVIGIMSTAGRLSGGILSEKLKRHRAKLGTIGIALSAAALMLIPVTHAFWSFLIVCGVIGFVFVFFSSLC
jgi:predicted MFS family arabinose efflux permease